MKNFRKEECKDVAISIKCICKTFIGFVVKEATFNNIPKNAVCVNFTLSPLSINFRFFIGEAVKVDDLISQTRTDYNVEIEERANRIAICEGYKKGGITYVAQTPIGVTPLGVLDRTFDTYEEMMMAINEVKVKCVPSNEKPIIQLKRGKNRGK